MVGELHCLNCARHLGDLVRTPNGRLALRHPGGQKSRPILLQMRPNGPRCARCGGKAMLEQSLITEEPAVQPSGQNPRRAA